MTKTKDRSLLIIDTAGPTNKLILAKDKQILKEKTWQINQNQPEQALVYLEEMLDQCNLELADLGLIIVNQGPTDNQGKPASFTGLKVGLTIGNGLKLALKIPIVGVSLKGSQWQQVVEKSDQLGQRTGFINPIYPSQPNISRPKNR